MKKIGILGGVTWASTADYYKLINQKINRKLGGYHTAEILINSVNFEQVVSLLKANNWNGVEKLFLEKAMALKKAGADFILISSNTIAKVARTVAEKTDLPLVNIIKVTSEEIHKRNFRKVGFLGTGFTMKSTFYFDELKEYGIDTVLPNNEEITEISDIIMKELAYHVINEDSKETLLRIIKRMVKEDGVEGVILGCTEIPMLIRQEDTNIILFDTTEIHTDYTVSYALEEA